MTCVFCQATIPNENVGAVLIASGEPLVRCHVCGKILRVDFVEDKEFA